MGEISQSRNSNSIEQKSSKMPANKSSLRIYLIGKFLSKVIHQKCPFFTNICWGFYFQKNFDVFNLAVATGSLLYLTPSKLKISILAETLTGLKSACPTVLYLSFLFHNINSITINKFKKWITIPACFRNEKISYTSSKF